MTYTKAVERGSVLRVMIQSWFALPRYWNPMMGVPLATPPIHTRESAVTPGRQLEKEMPTASEVHERAAVGVLNREHVAVPDLGDDPELGHHEGVAQGALGVACDLHHCVALSAWHTPHIQP